MDRMCGDESRHAVRTLDSDLIDDNEIRHPNHYCWSILLSLLNVMAIMEFSSPLISWQHHMCPQLLSPAQHQYMKALCFVREAEQMGRTSLHCVCKAVTEEYNGSFILLWKHGTEVHRIYTKQSRAEQSTATLSSVGFWALHQNTSVAWALNMYEDLTNLIYMC